MYRIADDFIIHCSEPYEDTGNTKVFTSAKSFLGSTLWANLIRLLITALHPPLLIMRKPKEMKSFTASNLFCVDFLAVWYWPCQLS